MMAHDGDHAIRSGEEDNLTQDGTVDLRGRPSVRSKGGRWTACSFVLGYGFLERMAYYGISSNLVLYLTKRLHQGTVTSANNVTNWVGTVWMTPILGAYIADAYLGRYWTFVFSSAIYIMGMILLTLSVSLKSLKPPSCSHPQGSGNCDNSISFQVVIFYTSLYIMALGIGGTKPNASTMGADQFDEFEPNERTHKLSFFNVWMFFLFSGTLVANTLLIYIQDNVGWGLGYGLPTLGLVMSIIVFLSGTRFYRHKVLSGSPFTRITQVLMAALRKRKLPLPSNPLELHELGWEEYAKNRKLRMEHTPFLSFLDRAAVKSSHGSPGMLCPVTQVEETKQMIKMLPILIATFMSSVMTAQINTLFIKQGTTLDRSMGPHFKIPPGNLTAVVNIFMLVSLMLYNYYFVPAIRKYTGNPRGITLLQRMGVGLVIHVGMMIIASVTERHRLAVVRDHGLQDKKATIPLSIFVLLPQFGLMGIADTFVDVAKIEFFYDQAPEGMKSLGASYFTTSLGIGHFLSSFLLSMTDKITKRGGNKGWIQNNLNTSHLDYYFMFLAILNFLNLIIFVVVSRYYVYNTNIHDLEVELNTGSGMLQEKAAYQEDKWLKSGDN